MDDSTYHVDISRGELAGVPCFWATITGPGLPVGGDYRTSESVWELCTDITMAIQEASPEFVAPFRLIPQGGRSQTFEVRYCVWCRIPGIRRIHHALDRRTAGRHLPA